MPLKKVAVHGLPRSGTSWLGEIFNSSEVVAYRYQPLFSYSFKHYLGVDCTEEQIEAFFNEILATEDPFILRTGDRGQGRCPMFTKSIIGAVVYKEVRYHQILPALLKRSKDVKLVLMVRHPIAVINSWLNTPREFRSDLGWGRLDEWRYAFKKNLNKPEEFNGYERWKEATQLFLRLKELYPYRVKLVFYNALIANPLAEVEKMFRFVGLPLEEQTLKFLEPRCDSVDSDPYSVNKIVNADNKWKSELEPEIQEAIRSDLNGTDLEYMLEL